MAAIKLHPLSLLLISSALLIGHLAESGWNYPVYTMCDPKEAIPVVQVPSGIMPEIRLVSSNYANGSVSKNLNCSMIFQNGANATDVWIYFQTFNMVETLNCTNASFCLGGVKYCTNALQGSIYLLHIPGNKTATITFKTSEYAIGYGFYIYISKFLYSDGSPNNFILANDPKEPYEDKCSPNWKPVAPTVPPTPAARDSTLNQATCSCHCV